MDLGIAGRVALVTAASKGLGRGAALALAREGCRVAICARGEDALAATAAELGPDTLAIAADVTDPDTPLRLVRETVERFGRLDILVANAGGPPKARALELSDDAVRAAVEANLLTSIRLVRGAVPHMRTRSWGRIVLVTSNTIKQPIPDLAASTVARTGLWGWAKSAAQDLADDGITLNVVAPGLHSTDRVRELGHAGRLGDPEDFGRVVAFLCSTSAAFVSGTALQVDGGGTLALL
ncbi:MAG TPA: SDR family oxidoreductase [Actinomycetota bacterium]|nr:SDR family oxidoreductase [Actinomycetota bacterium]